MRQGENIRDEVSFNGVDGLKAPEFIQALRIKTFSEDKEKDSQYVASLASMCFAGPALEWFENMADDVQSDWSLLRRALLARFSASASNHEEQDTQSFVFTGGNPKECKAFVSHVRRHSHAEGKSLDDQWTAHYAASCMVDDALTWHIELQLPVRNSWIKLEYALLKYFPGAPPHSLPPAGRIVVDRWRPMAIPSFMPKTQNKWLQEARERRKAHSEAGPSGLTSVHWLLVEKGEGIPDAAIQTGVDSNGDQLYCARAWVEEGIHPGKCARHFSGARIPYGNEEISDVTPYEVLVGDASAVCWVANPIPEPAGTSPPSQMRPFHAIEGGFRKDGLVYLLAQGQMDGHGWQPGKIGLEWDHCATGWGQKLFNHKHCRILTWA